jgi:hypothetical protein
MAKQKNKMRIDRYEWSDTNDVKIVRASDIEEPSAPVVASAAPELNDDPITLTVDTEKGPVTLQVDIESLSFMELFGYLPTGNRRVYERYNELAEQQD